MYDEKMQSEINGDKIAVEDEKGMQETAKTMENVSPYTMAGTMGQYGHYQIPEPEQMTRQQKKAQAKVEKAARKAQAKVEKATKKAQQQNMSAQQRKAQKEQKRFQKRYPLGQRMLASLLCGVLFAGAAFGTLYMIEEFTDLTILVNNSRRDSEDVPVGSVALGNEGTDGSGVTDAVVDSDRGNTDPLVQNDDISSGGVNSVTTVLDVSEVVKRVMPAVVSIENKYIETLNYWGQSYSQEGSASGSGIIVGTNDTELLIATNYHVIEGAEELEVSFINESSAPADVKGTDAENDLAIIAVQLDKLTADTKSEIAVAKLGDSDALEVGEPVIAIGNALGYGQSVTTGVVSAVNRQVEEVGDLMIQTDAAINPGNSGGALLNARGEVIGINSAKIGGNAIEGMGYAIPITYAEPIMENLMAQSTKIKVDDEDKGYLGISGVNVGTDVSELYKIPQGVYVYQVYEGTAAEAAGLRQGDVITALNGAAIDNMETLQRELQYYRVGTTVELTVMRAANGYQEEKVELVLGEKFEADEE